MVDISKMDGGKAIVDSVQQHMKSKTIEGVQGGMVGEVNSHLNNYGHKHTTRW